MNITMMKSKIHRATVTQADLTYEGSVSIDPKLIEAGGFFLNEKVDILNCNNGQRFSTYIIAGGPGEICLNGAAARLVQPGDIVIIVSYMACDLNEARQHKPQVVFVDEKNRVREMRQEDHQINLAN